MMRVLLCNCSASLPLPPVTPNKPQTLFTTTTSTSTTLNWPQKTLISALTGALSLGLAVSPLSSLALPSPLNQPQNHSTEYCRQEEREDSFDAAPESLTNEGIVEEAWEIVNDSFLDTARHRWSPDTWLVILTPLHEHSIYACVYVYIETYGHILFYFFERKMVIFYWLN